MENREADISVFSNKFLRELRALTREVRIPTIDILRALKQLLLREIRSEDPAYYADIFKGDVCGTVKFLTESARVSNEIIRYNIARIERQIQIMEFDEAQNPSKLKEKSAE